MLTTDTRTVARITTNLKKDANGSKTIESLNNVVILKSFWKYMAKPTKIRPVIMTQPTLTESDLSMKRS